MRKLNHGFFSQTIRKIHPIRITLLSILFICAAAACNANGQSAAPVRSEPSAPAASSPAAPSETLMSTIAAVAPPPASTGPPASSAATSPAAWKTYSSPSLQIALDYPPDWQIKEDASGVTFSSALGSTIKLLQVLSGGLSPQTDLNQADLPNTRCNQKVNPSGLSVRVCFDTISFSTMADFSTGAADHSKRVALVMGKSGDQSVFDAMLQTLKAIP